MLPRAIEYGKIIGIKLACEVKPHDANRHGNARTARIVLSNGRTEIECPTVVVLVSCDVRQSADDDRDALVNLASD